MIRQIVAEMVLKNKKIKPTKTEACLSLFILLVLAGIGAAILQKQFSFNPAVAVYRAVPPADAKVLQKDQKAAAGDWNEYLPAMIPLSPPEVFDPENLSDKINGKAELYLTSGFKGLKSQRFRMADTEDLWLEIFVYNMEGPQNAFSVFSQQRREDAIALEFAPFSYATPNAVFFVHGPFYVEIIASSQVPALREQLRVFSQAFIKATGAAASQLEELRLFPPENLDENSLGLISANGFGYDRFNRIYTAVYTGGEARLTAFISRRDSPQEAEQLVAGYHEFLLAFGGKDRAPTPPLAQVKVVDILGAYEVFFSRGNYLAGVHEAMDRKQAEQLAQRLDEALKKGVNDRQQ